MLLHPRGHKRYWGKVAIYGDYRPWTAHKEAGGDWSTFDEHSRRILLLRRATKLRALFRRYDRAGIGDDIVIVIVPSHDPTRPAFSKFESYQAALSSL